MLPCVADGVGLLPSCLPPSCVPPEPSSSSAWRRGQAGRRVKGGSEWGDDVAGCSGGGGGGSGGGSWNGGGRGGGGGRRQRKYPRVRVWSSERHPCCRCVGCRAGCYRNRRCRRAPHKRCQQALPPKTAVAAERQVGRGHRRQCHAAQNNAYRQMVGSLRFGSNGTCDELERRRHAGPGAAMASIGG